MHETTLIPLVEKLVKLADDKDVIAKRRGELLKDIYNDKTYESMDISLAIRIEKELADG